MGQEFVLKNKKIYIDERRHKYNEIKKYFEVLSEEAMHKFVKLYGSRNDNIDDVYNSAFDQGNSCIADVIEKAVELLIKNGVFDIDTERFTEVYINSIYYSYWETAFDSIAEKYIMIVADNESLDEYRTQRRNSRGKFRGGGFGVGAAIKGSAKAGAMNMATGAVHGVFNLAAKGMSSAFVASDKRKLFKDTDTLLTLANGINNACYSIQYQYIDFLHQEKDDEIYRYVTNNDVEKAKALFSNLEKPSFPEERKLETIIEIIKLDPYKSEYYKYIFDELGVIDVVDAVDRMTEYFNVDITDHKIEILNEHFKTLTLDTENESKKAKEKLISFCEKINLDINNEIIYKVSEIIKEYDRQFRTVNNIEFDTREEAVIAKGEKQKIEKFIDNIDHETEEKLQDAIKTIEKTYETQIKEKYITD